MSIEKWTNAGLPREWYQNDSSNARDLVNLKLHHPARQWNIVRWNSQNGGIELLVDNTWTPASEVLQGMRNKWHAWVKNNQPWSCCGGGLSPRYAAAWDTLPEAGTLTPEQLKQTQEAAQKIYSPQSFAQDDHLTADCTVEIVNSCTPVKSNFITSGVKDYLRNTHTSIRLIDEQGKIYSFGFTNADPHTWWNIFFTRKGEVRAPDSFEGMPIEKRVVTPIAITKTQFGKIKEEIETLHREKKDFNLFKHNCLAMASHVLNRLGLHVKITASVPRIAFRCLPLWLQTALSPLDWLITKVWNAAAAVLSPLSNCFSRKDTDPRHFDIEKPGLFEFMVPAELIQWQQFLPSTKTFNNPSAFLDSV